MRRTVFIAAVVVAASLAPLAAQTRSAIPRMPDGHPDLQGTYDIATLTPVERPAGAALVMSDDEAKKVEAQAAQRKQYGDTPLKGDRSAPPVGGDGSAGA